MAAIREEDFLKSSLSIFSCNLQKPCLVDILRVEPRVSLQALGLWGAL